MTARHEPTDRALAKAAGLAARLAPDLAALMALTDQLELDVRRQGVALVEQMDLLRFYLREATLARVIGSPLKGVKPTRLIKTKALKRKAKR